MLSKNKIKFIKSLDLKKNRDKENLFIAEGHKVVEELAGHFHCRLMAGLPVFFDNHPEAEADEVYIASKEELRRASLLKNPQDVVAVFEKPNFTASLSDVKNTLSLALDDVQDPGNLGTIIRLADWFGIETVFCSHESADIFNPKTVQATMGALSRVKIVYTDIAELLSSAEGLPVYGTFLDGDDMYDCDLSENGIIVMGNEGRGISSEAGRYVDHRLLIPNYPAGRETSESLNVGVATAVICAEFRRRQR